MGENVKAWPVRLGYLFGNRLLVNSNTRMLYAFIPVFLAGMGLTDGEYFNALFIAGFFGFMTPFLSPLAEFRGRRFGMGLSLALFIIGCVMIVLWPGFWVISFGLGLGTLGMAFFQATSQSYIGDETPYAKRGRYIAFLEMSWSISYFIGMPILSFIIYLFAKIEGMESWVWRIPFVLLAAFALVGLMLLTKIIPYTPPPASIRTLNDANSFKLMKQVFTYPPAIAALIFGVLIQGAAEYLNLTYSLWLDAQWGVQIATLGIVAAVFGTAEFCSEMSVAQLADKLGKTRMVATACTIGAVAGVLLPFLFGISKWTAILGTALFYVGFEMSIVSSFSIMTQVTPAVRATFMGLYAAFLQLGRMIADLTASKIQTLGGDAGFSWIAWTAAACFALALVFLKSVKTVPEDEDERLGTGPEQNMTC